MPSGRRTKATTAETDRKVTRRLVLERVKVREFNEEGTAANGPEIEAWVERGEFDGSQTGAIESYAGKPGTPDAKVGVFKAVPVRNWKGGVRHVQPALPKVERELLP